MSLKADYAAIITAAYVPIYSEIFMPVNRVIIVLTAVMELQRLLITKVS
jgi:hypothetical protein